MHNNVDRSDQRRSQKQSVKIQQTMTTRSDNYTATHQRSQHLWNDDNLQYSTQIQNKDERKTKES